MVPFHPTLLHAELGLRSMVPFHPTLLHAELGLRSMVPFHPTLLNWSFNILAITNSPSGLHSRTATGPALSSRSV
jgi:hypothetical protein